LTSGLLDNVQFGAPSMLTSIVDLIYDPIVAAIVGVVGRWPIVVFGLGMASLLVSFNLLDRALPEVTAEGSGFERIGRLVYRPLAMFLLGMAITSVTLSVSVSLSILVPLSAKGFIRRENTLPYIMGANITTFIDTLFAALLMGGAEAFTIVLVEMLSVALVSVVVLSMGYRWYERAVIGLLDLIMANRRGMVVFTGVMLVVPIGLLLMR
jgi:sodium-dependent phosphate cotransporter